MVVIFEMESGGEFYSLKWTDFRSDFTEGFRDLLQEEAMVDVTLAVEGQVLQAHKLVLAVCSPYFKTLFKINPCKHPIVILKDVSHSVFSHMLDFMYKGEVGVRQDDLTSFLKLAETLKVKGLTEGQLSKDSSGLKRRRIARKKIVQGPATDSESDDSFQVRKRFKRRTKNSSKGAKKPRDKFEVGNAADLSSNPLTHGNNDSNIKKPNRDKSGPENTADDDSSSNDEDDPANDDFEPSRTYYEPESNQDASDPGLQGGVDYQMLQTKRGRDMLLYDGFTFTQNRMCKDGMRWQCSHPKCKAYCRMSSAGWLTPHKNKHDHERPSEEEIRRRILRMELKARAQSSGATPGEIIRNALPANEYQTTDQRACYTRCIQRYRKSLLKKTTPQDTSWQGTSEIAIKEQVGSEPWIHKEEKTHSLVDGMWSTHPQPVQLTEEEAHRQLTEQKDTIHAKIGAYEI